MYIDYVLIEKPSGDATSTSKRRMRSHILKLFPLSNNNAIIIDGQRKSFELPYKMTCCSATDDCSEDFVYNFHLEYENSNKGKCAEVLEKAHIQLIRHFESEKNIYPIVASDGLSEYYCNKGYPKFQKFERQLRYLIFIIVTKAYGDKWVEQTLPSELKPKLNRDKLIESALIEMDLRHLIDYLFYGVSEVNFPNYIDDNYPVDKVKSLDKDELIAIIEKGRQKSIWNNFLVRYIHIDQPKEKMQIIRESRNKIAHCKQFYSADYKRSAEYLDLFIPQIEHCMEEVNIKDTFSVKDVVCGFGSYVVELSELSKQIGQAFAPAITQMAEIGQLVAKTLYSNSKQMQNSVLAVTRDLTEIPNIMRNLIDSSTMNNISQITTSLPQPSLLLPSQIDSKAIPDNNDEIAENNQNAENKENNDNSKSSKG